MFQKINKKSYIYKKLYIYIYIYIYIILTTNILHNVLPFALRSSDSPFLQNLLPGYTADIGNRYTFLILRLPNNVRKDDGKQVLYYYHISIY